MFYSKSHNKYIQEGSQFELDGVTYPPQWLNQATLEQKQAIGLEEVIETNSPFDSKYYWTGETLEGAVKTYTGTPKDINDIKTLRINEVKNQAYSILQPTDYIDLRNLRDPSYKPEWITWRDSIRSTASTTIDVINSAETVDQVAAIQVEWPLAPAL